MAVAAIFLLANGLAFSVIAWLASTAGGYKYTVGALCNWVNISVLILGLVMAYTGGLFFNKILVRIVRNTPHHNHESMSNILDTCKLKLLKLYAVSACCVCLLLTCLIFNVREEYPVTMIIVISWGIVAFLFYLQIIYQIRNFRTMNLHHLYDNLIDKVAKEETH